MKNAVESLGQRVYDLNNLQGVPILSYRIAGNFAGAKLRGITPEGTRRSFRGFNFRGARTHGEARRYRYSASGNFRSFYFRENCEILHQAKISRYTIFRCTETG